MTIHRLSTAESNSPREGSAVVMVGSFAPVHRGHFDAVRAASRAITEHGISVESIILTPNSDPYLLRKMAAKGEELTWFYERRIEEIATQDSPFGHIPTFVDDISGARVGLNEINLAVPETIHRHLGIAAEQLYFVTGSDQLQSMQAHLASDINRAVCVLRPGHLERIQEVLRQDWVSQAVNQGRYIITERDDMKTDYSSTNLRSVA